MPFEIRAQKKEEIISITHTGDVDLRELNDARERSRLAMMMTGFTRIFVDATKVTNTLSMTEHFVFNGSHHQHFPPDIKIAITFDADSFDYNKYVEEAAGSMGTNLRAFVDTGAAREWLVQT